jgi:hypothetical protein
VSLEVLETHPIDDDAIGIDELPELTGLQRNTSVRDEHLLTLRYDNRILPSSNVSGPELKGLTADGIETPSLWAIPNQKHASAGHNLRTPKSNRLRQR